jgi:hypothetical protein
LLGDFSEMVPEARVEHNSLRIPFKIRVAARTPRMPLSGCPRWHGEPSRYAKRSHAAAIVDCFVGRGSFSLILGFVSPIEVLFVEEGSVYAVLLKYVSNKRHIV